MIGKKGKMLKYGLLFLISVFLLKMDDKAAKAPGNKSKEPECLTIFKKLSEGSKLMQDTVELAHREAYSAAEKAVLVDKKTGYLDIDKLDDVKNRTKFAKKMSDFYLSTAKQGLKVKEGAKFSKLEEGLLVNAYARTTPAKIKNAVMKAGKDFTFDHFYQKHRPGMMKSLKEDLDSTTVSHFEEDHIKEIVKYTGAHKFLDHKLMNIGDALEAWRFFDQLGMVPEKHYKDAKSIFYKPQSK
jgi:hypothetical protein